MPIRRLPKFGIDFPQADIVIGGPPCQPFSVGGRCSIMRRKRHACQLFGHFPDADQDAFGLFL